MRRYDRKDIFQVFLAIAFAVVILVGVLFFAGFWQVQSSYTVSAYVSNARSIAQYSTVFEAGLPVGLVTGVERRGPDAILVMRINHGIKPLPVNSTIQLGLRSLAGESDVLLEPGNSKRTVPDNGSLGLSQDQGYTEVDQILNSLAGSTEGRFRQFLQGAGAGVGDQGTNLNNTVGGFTRLVNQSPPLTSLLANQRYQVADIVQYFGNIMGSINQRSAALQTFATGAASTFDTVATRDRDLNSMIQSFPSLVDAARRAGTSITANSNDISDVALHLTKVAKDLTPAIDALGPGTAQGLKTLQSLGDAAPQVTNLLKNVIALKPGAESVLSGSNALMCQANPAIAYLAPYGRDLAAWFENFGGGLVDYVPQGGHPFLAEIAEPTAGTLNGYEPDSTAAGVQSLVDAGIFSYANGYDDFHMNQPPGERNDVNFNHGFTSSTTYGAAHTFTHVNPNCDESPLPASSIG